MKKLFATIGSMLVVSLCSMAQLQDRDTASMEINDRGGVEETREDVQKGARDEQDENQAGPKIQLGENGTGVRVQGSQSTDQELEKDAEEMEKNLETATIDKEGPNGEKLFMERGKYFYYNEDGKKVKVKKSEVRDKSVEENSEEIKNNK
jgi:hypothetical protein